MAPPTAPAQTDKDLASIAEARTLARRAKQAQLSLAEFSQEKIDAIVDAMAAGVTPHAEPLARLAVEETGYGVVADKVQKNLFGSRDVYNFIRPMKTVGVVNRLVEKKVIEIAEPFGVVAAIVPSTNPTSTAIYKILIAIKARCAIVLSPHPSAGRCITRVAELMDEAACRAGLPAGAIGWMNTVTLEGTQELMKVRDVAVILATGGMGLVRAAYSAGKPAYGVGPGNAPCYIEQSADLGKAAADILYGKCFDNGVLCSSPNSVVVDRTVEGEVRRQFQTQGGHFLSAAETDLLAKVLITPQRLPNPALVGKSAAHIADRAGIRIPDGTRALIAELKGVGRDHPLSIEKLCPVLSYYIVNDWREGCDRCREILRYGGMGHTMSIHSQDDEVILQFGLHKPAYRICVNTPSTLRVHRVYHRPRPVDDARLRRVWRQHHLRQHLAEAPAEYQAARLRDSGRHADPRCNVSTPRLAAGRLRSLRPPPLRTGSFPPDPERFSRMRWRRESTVPGVTRRGKPAAPAHPHLARRMHRRPVHHPRTRRIRFRSRCAHCCEAGRKNPRQRENHHHARRPRRWRSRQGLYVKPGLLECKTDRKIRATRSN